MSAQHIMNQSLYKTKAIVTEEQKLKTKAKGLKLKLEQAKKKKELQLEKCVRESMVAYYQAQFQAFKEEVEEEAKSQSYSFQLIKEFKLNEITQFEQVVKEAIENINRCRKETDEMEESLRKCYQSCLSSLHREMEEQKSRMKASLQKQKAAKIEEYKSQICIQ